MIGFLGIGLAPVVMSSEQEARHRLLSCQPKEIAHKERDRWMKGGDEGMERRNKASMRKMCAFCM